MNGGLINPNETKHLMTLDARIRPNGAANNGMGLL